MDFSLGESEYFSEQFFDFLQINVSPVHCKVKLTDYDIRVDLDS
jgi:hypothetical protein